MSRATLDVDEMRQLKKQYESGATTLEIARDLKKSEGYVRLRLIRAGTRMRSQGKRPFSTYTQPRGYAQVTGAHRLQLFACVREIYGQGVSIRSIAQDSGKAYGTIHRWLMKSGAIIKPPGGQFGAGTRRMSPEQKHELVKLIDLCTGGPNAAATD